MATHYNSLDCEYLSIGEVEALKKPENRQITHLRIINSDVLKSTKAREL